MTYKLTKTSQLADPYYGAVSLLLHGDGADGSTQIIDSSVNPKTVTAVGDAQISTEQSKFGGTSLRFDGTGDYLTALQDSSYSFGTGDFTIEVWLYITAYGGGFQDFGGCLIDTRGVNTLNWPNGMLLCLTTNGSLRVFTNVTVSTSTSQIPLNTWTHVSLVRSGGSVTFYIGGQSAGTFTFTNNLSQQDMTIGTAIDLRAQNTTLKYIGYIDDLRITKGVARYTSNFTPPTQPFKTLSENFGIVNDNSLKLYLDVGNDTSYVGSGTTWNDLSGLRADLGLKGNFNTGTISTGIVTSFVNVATALGNIGITTTEITGINTTSVDIDQTLKEFSGIIGSGTTVTSIGISTVYINPATLNTDTLVAEISFGSYISTTSIGATFGNLFNDRYLNFDGESNYVYGSTAPLANATQGTIGAWINTSNLSAVDNFIDVVTVFDGDVGITTTEITGITTTGINVGDYLKPTIDIIGSGTTVTSIGIGTVYINPATSNDSSLTNAVLSFGYYSGGHIYGESLPGSDTYWAQLRLDNGYPSLIIDDDDVLPSAASTIKVDNGQWHYVAVTGDGTNWSFYVDGAYNSPTFSQGDGTYWFNDASGLTTYTIGALDRINKTNYFNGKIAQVHVYDRALSQSEILQNYNAHQSRFLGSYISYEILTFVASGTLTVTGNATDNVSIFKTSGTNSWDSQAYTTSSFTAPCTLEFNKQAASGDNGLSYAMIGWNQDPTTNASYTSLDYAAYPYRTDTYSVYHNGSQVLFSGSWSTSEKFYLVYDTDGTIKHYNGSKLLYSVNYGTGKTVYVDGSYNRVNATFGGFSNIRVARKAWNGSEYI